MALKQVKIYLMVSGAGSTAQSGMPRAPPRLSSCVQPVIVVQVRKTYELLRAGWQASGLGVRRHQEREGGTERGELGQAGRRASGGGGGGRWGA